MGGRFLKGTTDHDSDGKMGGSLKENDMADTKTKKAPRKSRAKAKPMEQKAAEKVVAAENETPANEGMDVQSGMEPGPSAKELRAEHNKRFEEADEKGRAALTEEAQVGLQVRGY